jgi:transposase
MKGLSEVGTVYLHREFVDFRKAINGLVVIVEQSMQLSPYQNGVFVFCNRGRDKLKILYWDRNGFCLWYKRLEKDKFHWPQQMSNAVIELNGDQLGWLLRGLSIVEHQTLHYRSLS